MNEIDQKLFNAASELVEERRKLRDEAKEAAQTIAKLKRELEQASIATRALESRCAQVHDSLLVKEGQVEAYKKRLSEMTNITYDQLREHIGGVMSKHVDSVVEELKRRMGG
jgi:septal ring factor EnvC (AmiA/AmiB activator)